MRCRSFAEFFFMNRVSGMQDDAAKLLEIFKELNKLQGYQKQIRLVQCRCRRYFYLGKQFSMIWKSSVNSGNINLIESCITMERVLLNIMLYIYEIASFSDYRKLWTQKISCPEDPSSRLNLLLTSIHSCILIQSHLETDIGMSKVNRNMIFYQRMRSKSLLLIPP